MALDPRSRERLEALGRTLPRKLSPPKPSTPGSLGGGERGGDPAKTDLAVQPIGAARHPVEQAQDPEALFRALISASPDGTVPSHLLDRLRDLETSRQSTAESLALPSQTRPSGQANARAGQSPRSGQRNQRPTANRSRPGTAQGGDQALYSAFAQLLLEDDPDA